MRVYILRSGAWLFPWLAFALGAIAGPAHAQPQATSAPVMVWNREIVVLRAPFEQMSPADRAASVAPRILAIPENLPQYRVEAKKATIGDYKGAWIMVNGQTVFGLLTGDADLQAGETFDRLTARAVANLEGWLKARGEQRRLPLLLRGVGLSLFATVLLALVVTMLARLSRRWASRRGVGALSSTQALTIAGINLRPYLMALQHGVIRLMAWGLGLGLGHLWLTFVLSRFPYSQPWGTQLGAFLVNLFRDFGHAILRSIPKLFIVVVIFLLARLVARVVTAFFKTAESSGIETAWLEPETARATRRLVVVLIWVFALIVAYPYIPGSESEAFKGVSVFLGLMVSLGSAGLIGQVIGGLVVVYGRAFHVGDYVRVGEYEGIVQEIGMLSTKLLTRKREEITMPNAVLVGATAVNYSPRSTHMGALVSTSVTIGYDVPWRQVHGLLLLAAQRTPGILEGPPPRVLQGELSDFYVQYDLLFSIQKPEDRYYVLSNLHQQIQDAFNEYGVQIMSPNFEAQPDRPVVVPKDHWYAAPARPEGGDPGAG